MLVDLVKKLGFFIVALTLTSFIVGGAKVRPIFVAHSAMHEAHAMSVEHGRHYSGVADSVAGTTKHIKHKTAHACLDACCGPAACAVPARFVSSANVEMSEAENMPAPTTALANLAPPYRIERPPRV